MKTNLIYKFLMIGLLLSVTSVAQAQVTFSPPSFSSPTFSGPSFSSPAFTTPSFSSPATSIPRFSTVQFQAPASTIQSQFAVPVFARPTSTVPTTLSGGSAPGRVKVSQPATLSYGAERLSTAKISKDRITQAARGLTN